ncbi:hypothetical protein EDC56_0550 [Sinobacterium caligoides]|uniref:Uncharacterized protein n=1 Tax=Sinobacterium caligoides TaxID=933926 RepID=A0A3N2DYX5_9GAMM|nr:hypothetical protein [Sinobacterium caligoides]ROS05028.1 hypothetical protein EDC56_0550 [Sinobacterium caligoides]
MQMDSHKTKNSNIISIFSGRPVREEQESRIIRIAPECDGLSMLYTNNGCSNKLFRMSILCWALRDNGEIDALVPWLEELRPCQLLNDPLDGRWEGFFEPSNEYIFDEAPLHQVNSLHQSAEYFATEADCDDVILQEFADTIGTHALLCEEKSHSITLTEVLSWRLLADGRIQAMLIDEEKITSTPVLPGDPCLYPSTENPSFRYFFQHHIANQIKDQDPDTLSAISILLTRAATDTPPH